MKIYFEMFNCQEDVLSHFDITQADLKGLDILFAHYDIESYEGTALVILRDHHTGQFFEVNGGHCSCYGLEGQWELEETTLAALNKRNTDLFNDVVKSFIHRQALMQDLDLEDRAFAPSISRKM